ncbi:hypothetical protein RDI58_004977 [Solanum bulbocastanum]|uniref:Uncharacterized protein n=1 Tax=Solanum bulbocastanum TaxID=147425 RepID=A0AAN8YLZ4_SOLBU
MWDNSQLDVDLTNQSIITQEPRQQSTGVECVQDEVVRVTDNVNVNDEGADYVRGAQSAQDEGIDCAQGARCALEKSDDCMRGAQCDQEESTDCLRGTQCAQDETIDCMQGARCAQDESVDCMQGARRAQDESAQTGLSKRGRLYKKNVMNDYVCEASMKRSRKC